MLLKKFRYSIWHDLVYDIWKKKDIKYMLNNSVISILVGIPALLFSKVIICWNFFYHNESVISIEKIIGLQIIVCLLVFILTSFRKTRFLGEPERYAEFIIPFVSILLVLVAWNHFWIILIVLSFSFSIIVYHFALFGFNEFKTPDYILTLKNIIEQTVARDEYRIFSNNTSLLNYFINDLRFKILQPDISYDYTGRFHFKEIFPDEYFKVSPSVIIPLINDFNIDWFVLDINFLSEEFFLPINNNTLTKVAESGNLILYKFSNA